MVSFKTVRSFTEALILLCIVSQDDKVASHQHKCERSLNTSTSEDKQGQGKASAAFDFSGAMTI